MRPKLISLPALKLAGFVCRTTSRFGENFTAIPKFWQAYIHDGRMNRLLNEAFAKSRVQYGVGFPEEPETGRFEYLIGVEAKDGVCIPELYEVRELPSASYAVFSSSPAKAEKFSAEVYNTWAYIYGTWLPSSGMAMDGKGLQFELYDERILDAEEKVCDVYIPVVYARDTQRHPRQERTFAMNPPAFGRDFQSSPNTTAVNI
jgi:AraC family transcriptional regulator